MKKALLFVIMVFSGIILQAQVLVTTDPLPKNVILEEFTGIHCQYCPEGHAISQALVDNNPGRVFAINLHQGGYATPGTGEPDYRTIFGDSLASQASITAYPYGTVNRHLFPGTTATGIDRGAWGPDADIILAQTSPVNLGVMSQYNPTTRELTITVELYYTANSATSTNRLNVALVQDSIISPQTTTTGTVAAYTHMHMLRYFITGQWGDTVNQTTQGSLVTRVYHYTVPASYNNIACLVEHCKVAAYIAQGRQEILTGYMVPAIGGTNKYIGKIANTAAFVKAGSQSSPSVFSVDATSGIQITGDFIFTLTSANKPADWNADFSVNATPYTSTATISLAPNIPQSIQINVTPGSTPAVPSFTLTMKSVTFPQAPEKIITVYVIANVHDLVIDGSGDANMTLSYDSIYMNGLNYANDVHHATTTARVMAMAMNDNAMGAVHNIYANISWTFPALRDIEAQALEAHLNAGGRLLIGGQDIGWDIMSGATGSNGDSITRDFYTNYLHASFVADGSSTNAQLTPVTGESIFGTVGSSTIINPFGGTNLYPDQINPGTGAVTVFNYNGSSSLTAGIRAQVANYKIVYLGIGLEMLGDKAVKNRVMKEAYRWFWDFTSVEEFDQAMAECMGQNFPNPVFEMTVIPFQNLTKDMVLEIRDLTGRLVTSYQVAAGTRSYPINTSSLEQGIYVYTLKDGANYLCTRKLIITR